MTNEDLQDELDLAQVKIKRLKRQLAEFDDVLSLTGIQDRTKQIEHLKAVLTGLMEHPELTAKTAKGRIGELSRLKISNNGAGDDIPFSLRGPNFHRAQGNRVEAERIWAEQQARAEQLIEAGDLPREAWETAIGSGQWCYSTISKVLDWAGAVSSFHTSLVSEVSSYLPSEDVPVPNGFVTRLNEQIEGVVFEAYLNVGRRGLGSASDISVSARTALEHAFSFVPEDADWRKHGMTEQEWLDRDESRFQTKKPSSTELPDDWSGGLSVLFAKLFIKNDFDTYKREVEANPELLKNTFYWSKDA